jgi:hypothetical protein
VKVNGILFEQNECERRTMMKKVLALVMVLGMAGFASAGLQLTVNGAAQNEITVNVGDVMMIGIQNGQGADQYNAALILSGMGSWTGDHKLNSSIGQAQGWEYFGPTEGIGDVWFAWFAQPVTDKLPAGIIGEVGFKCIGKGDAVIALTGDDLSPIGQLMIHQVPEPMTLSLLGLGALVLRRRS